MFLNGINQVTAGNTASAQATFVLKVPPANMSEPTVTWEMIDADGSVWANGTALSLVNTPSPTQAGVYRYVTEATISIPSVVPANNSGSSYQIRWTLRSGTREYTLFDSFTVLPLTYRNLGPIHSVEMYGANAQTQITLPGKFDSVSYECYYGNSVLTFPRPADNLAEPFNTADGYVYTGHLDYADLISGSCHGPSLDPFMIMWRYKNANEPEHQEIGGIFFVTPTMLSASQEIQQFLNHAYIESGINPGSEFKPESLFSYLRMGRDLFNGAVMPTNFDMTNAASALRAFWLNYSMAFACRSQYLAEGMKAFNFGGQAITLDVDRTQYWDSIAQSLEAQISEHISIFKKNLWKRGILGGDGSNLLSLRMGAIGSIGIAISPVAPLRGNSGYGAFGPFLR